MLEKRHKLSKMLFVFRSFIIHTGIVLKYLCCIRTVLTQTNARNMYSHSLQIVFEWDKLSKGDFWVLNSIYLEICLNNMNIAYA